MRYLKEADDPDVPEWPDETKCPCCGLACWTAEAADGTMLMLDTEPMSTELWTDLYGEQHRVRASYRHPAVRSIGGWRLHDPVSVPYGDDAGWYWYASRMPMQVEVDPVLYSEHVYSCKRVSPDVIQGLVSKVTFTGALSGDPDAKRKGAKVREQNKRERKVWQEAFEAGYEAKLPSELGVHTEEVEQLALF